MTTQNSPGGGGSGATAAEILAQVEKLSKEYFTLGMLLGTQGGQGTQGLPRLPGIPETLTPPVQASQRAVVAGNGGISDVIRQAIRASGTDGVTYADITAALTAAGIKPAKNYPYKLINRWKEAKAIRVREGRIYWAKEAA